MSVQRLQPAAVPSTEQRHKNMVRLVERLQVTNRIGLGTLWAVAIVVALIFIAIIVFLVVQGIAYLFNPSFYGTNDPASIGPELFNTFYILILSEIFLFPIGLAAAIYLVEYARPGPLVTAIQFAAQTLAGVPSIVLGMFGIAVFGVFISSTFHVSGLSRMTGALTLLCLNLPFVLQLFADTLAAVPRDLREGSLALGTTRWRMIRTVVLPSALPGLVTGLILSAGKIIGEAAALIFTTGTSNPSNVYTLNPFIASDNLTIHLWYVKTSGVGTIPGLTDKGATAVSAGSATLLILILLAINLIARGLGRLIERRVTAA